MLEDKRKAMLDQFEQEKAAMAKVRPFCSFVSIRCPDTCFLNCWIAGNREEGRWAGAVRLARRVRGRAAQEVDHRSRQPQGLPGAAKGARRGAACEQRVGRTTAVSTPDGWADARRGSCADGQSACLQGGRGQEEEEEKGEGQALFR